MTNLQGDIDLNNVYLCNYLLNIWINALLQRITFFYEALQEAGPLCTNSYLPNYLKVYGADTCYNYHLIKTYLNTLFPF